MQSLLLALFMWFIIQQNSKYPNIHYQYWWNHIYMPHVRISCIHWTVLCLPFESHILHPNCLQPQIKLGSDPQIHHSALGRYPQCTYKPRVRFYGICNSQLGLSYTLAKHFWISLSRKNHHQIPLPSHLKVFLVHFHKIQAYRSYCFNFLLSFLKHHPWHLNPQ